MTLVRIYYHGGFNEGISINEVEFHPEMLQLLVELGIIEIYEGMITPEQLKRVYQVFRLKNNLGVNLTGAAIILDLLERIETLQEEIEKLTGGETSE